MPYFYLDNQGKNQKNPKDRILWKEIYEEYKDEIYRSKIREGEEQDEFDKFYKELQHLTACKD